MRATLGQIIRYGIVGLVSNAIGYLLYIIFTWIGFGPKLAMTLLYCIGVIQTFVFNKRWSFRFLGAATPALVRYASMYAIGYGVNFLTMLLLVDQVGFPHQLVMAGLVFFMAIFFFVGQKYWVFREVSSSVLGDQV